MLVSVVRFKEPNMLSGSSCSEYGGSKFRRHGYSTLPAYRADCELKSCPWRIATVSRFNAMSHCYSEAKQQFASHTLDDWCCS